MSQCSGCAAELPDEARFCLLCGLPVETPVCAGCGETLPARARFCMSCGTPRGTSTQPVLQAPVASRRVTSILFGDLVGFTSLSEVRDQEEVRELLSRYFDECRQVIARYGGTVEKFIGDAVMAVWGVPVSHEDDPERAVRAGLELVAAVAEFGADVGAPDLALRVGIVTGEVAVTVGATQEGMVAGDAVNTAARVQSAASPGSVWVDETTKLLTAAAITYADAGSHQLKGKADPVPLWSVRAVVAAVGGAQRADGLESPLVGRDRELRLVKELFHHCEESGRPTLLVVDGEPGAGKTRLGWEFEKYVDGVTSKVLWHSGRCIAYGEGVAYYALAEAVRGRLQGLAAQDDPEEQDIDELLARGLRRYVADEDERSWMHDRLAALLGVGTIGTFGREDLFSSWATFFERVGEGHPVTLVIDDAQHADEGLLSFVEHLLSTSSFGCFVILLTRPGLLESRPALATHRRANVVHIPTLSDRDIARLLDGLVAGLPEPLRDSLVARAEGVPLFAVETVRSLIDRDLVVPRGGQYVLAVGADSLDLDAVGAPASLQALIAARLDALSPEQRRLVDRASVLGETFEPAAVAGVCSDLPDVPGVLHELVRLQILTRETSRISSEFGSYRFVQSAVRQVAYGTLSRRDRKAIHLAVVAQFDALGEDGDATAAVRAQHYLDALTAVPGDDDADVLRQAALSNLRKAAERARSLGSPDEAARHLAAAMALTEDPAVRGRLGCDLAGAECAASRYEVSMAHAQEARELLEELGDRVGAGRAVAVLGQCLANGLSRNDEAAALVEPWWAELRDRPDAVDAASDLSRVVMWTRWRLKGDVHDVIEARLRTAEMNGRSSDVIECYNALAVHYATVGAVGLERVLLEASADLSRRHHDLFALAITLVNLSSVESAQDLGRALAAAREATEVSTRNGNPWMRNYAEGNYAIVAWNAGAWDLIDGLGVVPDGGSDSAQDETIPSIQSLRAHACGEAFDAFALAPYEDGDDLMRNSWRAFFEATEALHREDLSTALDKLIEAAALTYESTAMGDDFPHMWAPATELALTLDDDRALQRLLAFVEDATTVMPLALQAHRARVLALLAVRDGRDDEVEPLMTETLERYAAWGSEPYTAKVKAEYGRWLLARQRDDEGRRLLDEARATYERLGAVRWLAELDGAGLGALVR